MSRYFFSIKAKNALIQAIYNLHNCDATWVESVSVKEIFKGEIVWEGTVQVFDLIDHPTAKRCYAWSYLIDESGKRKFVAVLHKGPIDSPQKAVQAAIVSEHKKRVPVQNSY